MIQEIKQIFDELQSGGISFSEAEQSIIDLWENNEFTNECMCCYMTTGEHSKLCPQYKSI